MITTFILVSIGLYFATATASNVLDIIAKGYRNKVYKKKLKEAERLNLEGMP